MVFSRDAAMPDDDQQPGLVPFEANGHGEKSHLATENRALPHRLKFFIVDTGETIETRVTNEMVIGRGASNNIVDVDLNPHDGHMLGISRNHACILISGDRIMIKDTGSVNGTRLNGKKLTTDYVYELHDGDVLQLGMMLLRIFFVLPR